MRGGALETIDPSFAALRGAIDVAAELELVGCVSRRVWVVMVSCWCAAGEDGQGEGAGAQG